MSITGFLAGLCSTGIDFTDDEREVGICEDIPSDDGAGVGGFEDIPSDNEAGVGGLEDIPFAHRPYQMEYDILAAKYDWVLAELAEDPAAAELADRAKAVGEQFYGIAHELVEFFNTTSKSPMMDFVNHILQYGGIAKVMYKRRFDDMLSRVGDRMVALTCGDSTVTGMYMAARDAPVLYAPDGGDVEITVENVLGVDMFVFPFILYGNRAGATRSFIEHTVLDGVHAISIDFAPGERRTYTINRRFLRGVREETAVLDIYVVVYDSARGSTYMNVYPIMIAE